MAILTDNCPQGIYNHCGVVALQIINNKKNSTTDMIISLLIHFHTNHCVLRLKEQFEKTCTVSPQHEIKKLAKAAFRYIGEKTSL